MMPLRFDRYRHVIFIDSVLGAPAQNLAPRSAWPTTAFHPRSSLAELEAADETTAEFSEDETRFIHWLFRQAQLDARHYRPETLRRRLHACLRVVRAGSVGEA